MALETDPRGGDATPPASVTPRQLAAIMVGLMLGTSLAALDLTIVATAVKTIADDLGGLSLQAWATTTYLITSAITTPLYGKMSDTYGRKPLFLVAIAIFVAGSFACAFAGSMYQLAAFRALQGLGAGGLLSLSLTIVGDLVPARERARYSGYLIAVYAVASVLGPVAGGFFAGQEELFGIAGWRWVFLVNVPVGVIALLVVAGVLRVPCARQPHRIDWSGAVALSVALVPLLIVAEEGRTWGWASYESLLCYVVGAAGIALFVVAEQRMGADALLPLRFFRAPAFRLGAVASLASGFGMFGVITALPLYLQIVGGAAPAEAGLLMLPLVAGIMVTSAVSAKVIARTGRYRQWPLVGASLMIAGLVWLSAIGADTSFWATAACMIIFGVGLGGTLQPLLLAVQNALPPADVGVATASVSFFRQLGGTLGAAALLSILFSTVQDRVAAAFRAAAGTPAFQSALADPEVLAQPANRQLAEALGGGGAGLDAAVLEDSSFLAQLHPELAHPFLVGFSDSMSLAFALGAVVLVLALVAALAIEETPLRDEPAGGPEPQRPPAARPDTAPVAPEPPPAATDTAPLDLRHPVVPFLPSGSRHV
jgi:EmrB/QacA subfamily drug resistance transporter